MLRHAAADAEEAKAFGQSSFGEEVVDRGQELLRCEVTRGAKQHIGCGLDLDTRNVDGEGIFWFCFVHVGGLLRDSLTPSASECVPCW